MYRYCATVHVVHVLNVTHGKTPPTGKMTYFSLEQVIFPTKIGIANYLKLNHVRIVRYRMEYNYKIMICQNNEWTELPRGDGSEGPWFAVG